MKMQKISIVLVISLVVSVLSPLHAQVTYTGPVTIQQPSEPILWFEQTGTQGGIPPQLWRLTAGSSFSITDQTAFTIPVTFATSTPYYALSTAKDGVGIGLQTAQAQLHVYGNDYNNFPDPKLLVENATSTTSARTLVELKNNGGCQILMRNTNNNNNLTLTQNNAGSFFFQSRIGGSKTTFMLKPNSQVFTIQRDDVNLMQSRSNGDLWIAGALVGPSDRAMKADFADVDRQQVLQKLVEMPITTWRYKTDEEIRHIGPMAQDFRAAFSLGADDKTIYPIDSIGISLVAIQALHQQVQEKDQQIAELQAQLAEQKDELKTQQSQSEKQHSQLLEQLAKQQSELEKQTEEIQQQQKFSAALAERLDQLEFNAKQTVLTSAN
jgi:hypothetical protein